MKTFEFVAEADYKRLDVFIAENGGFTRSRAAKLIEGGNVELQGKTVVKASLSVKTDDVVRCTLPDETELDVIAEDIPLDIVYEDEHLLVVNKPQGMTVHPACGNYTGTLVNALLYCVKDLSGINGVLRPGIVHRLDKDTSGLLVVAKNDSAHVELQRQIQCKECRRIYAALLEGVLKLDEGVIDRPVGRSLSDRQKKDVVAGGRRAEGRLERRGQGGIQARAEGRRLGGRAEHDARRRPHGPPGR